MIAELFVDTSAWYPLARRAHPDHERLAAAFRQRILDGRRIVTTNLVIAESHALLLIRTGRDPALRFLTEVRSPPNEVVASDPDIEARAIASWLTKFSDQRFSLTDAVSFEVMRMRRISEVLTLDRHFATAGFVVIGA